MASHGHDAHGEHHVLPLSVYWGVFGALLVLTVLTYLVSFAGLPGSLSIAVAMAVAITKATLVCMYFMHLKFDERINSIVLVVSILTMFLFFGFTLLDEQSRGLSVPEEATLAWQNEQARLKAIADAAAPAGEHGAAPAAGHGTAPAAEPAAAAAPAAHGADAPAGSGAPSPGSGH